jgi:hypothetical protein
MICNKWYTYAARLGAKLFQCYAAGLELVTIRGLDAPVEELFG